MIKKIRRILELYKKAFELSRALYIASAKSRRRSEQIEKLEIEVNKWELVHTVPDDSLDELIAALFDNSKKIRNAIKSFNTYGYIKSLEEIPEDYGLRSKVIYIRYKKHNKI
ncbi:MAG: hypothetical protein Nk1A_9080 [Endomicrobiia bacterium]|nr:MAG: hypothetical protein Nk1A_9080 [Endomicrobiia bacterium]